MRLKNIESGHRRAQALMLRRIASASGHPPSDIVRACLYRPELFGKKFLTCMEDAMRGPSDWSIGERELFATFVSKTNQCTFCIAHHSAVANKALDGDAVSDLLDDWRSAPLDAKVRATLGLLEKLTLAPGDVGPDDIAPLRAAGVSDKAIEDAIYVCAMFNTVNRIADALGFEALSPDAISRLADSILDRGYAM